MRTVVIVGMVISSLFGMLTPVAPFAGPIVHRASDPAPPARAGALDLRVPPERARSIPE
jgi:hypothetical protein